jgi:dienelactone hydrolase
MRITPTIAFVVVATVGFTTMDLTSPVAAAPTGPEPVEIAQDNGVLKAMLFRPDGAGPFPAVIGLHGCEGLLGRNGTVEARYSDWAEHLTKAGFVVIYPDSYGSRGLGPQCAIRRRAIRTDLERVADANAARRWLQTQSYVKADHISLLGWSHGGVAALWTVRPTAVPHDSGADFRSAVAFYPSCRRLRETAWSARVPTLILIGSADDWTPASACQQMVAGARGRSARAEIVVYPGAYHEFDRANAPIRLRTGLLNTVDPSGRAHGGTNPAARNDALKRVPAWLEK